MRKLLSKLAALATWNGGWIALAAIVIMVAEKAVELCAFPMWHYEPEVPAHLRGKMKK